MREDRLKLVKKEIRSVIITYPKGVSLEHFLKAYRELIGSRLPTREFGYISDIDFLNSISDVVRIQVDRNGDYLLNCIVDETTEHIKSLVVRQKDSKVRRSKNNSNNSNNFKITSKVFQSKPFISASLRENLFKVLVDFPEGIDYHSLLLAYRKVFKRPLNLEFLSDYNHEKLEKLAIAVSELEVQVVEDTLKLFYKPLVNTTTKNVIDTASDSDFENTLEEKTYSKSPEVHKISAVPHVVIDHFEKVMKLYPDGVLAKHFPLLYEKISKQPFDMLDLGYNSFLDLADALPEVFIAVKSLENPNDWMLFHPCFSDKANQLKDMNKQIEISKENLKNVEPKNMLVPADMASPTLSYSPPQLPNDIDLSLYIPVFISASVNPGCFWFKIIHNKNVTDRFRELEEDMQCFYHSAAADSLVMSHKDINIGSTCVAFEDDNWYRVTVTSSPIDNFVNVYFVDYGGWEKVQCSNLRYLKYSFITLPSQAFKAKLAFVKPPKGTKVWSKRAEVRFLQLCIKSNIMAKVHLEFDEILSVLLCDTSKQEDLHFADTLIQEGLAEICYEDELLTETSDNSDVNEAQDLVSHQISREVISEKSFPQKLSLGDGYEVHLISIQDQVYVSAADIRFLFWPDKSDEVVKLRLEFKNIIIPTTVVSSEKYPDLFLKCENCSVRGFQNLSNNQVYSVSLYLLTDVMRILNTLGHSSIPIRETIKKALSILNSGNEQKWMNLKQLSDQQANSANISNNNNKDDFDTYCLYDLKALYEALKCEKMRLEKIYNQSNSDRNLKEIRKTDLFANKIKEKIELVQSVCSTYS